MLREYTNYTGFLESSLCTKYLYQIKHVYFEESISIIQTLNSSEHENIGGQRWIKRLY